MSFWWVNFLSLQIIMPIKKTSLFGIFLFFLLFPSFAFALLPQLDYPEIRGIDIDDLIRGGDISITQVALYLYYFFIFIGGTVAFLGLLLGGIKWLTSSGSPARIGEAKNQIIASFLGALLLLGSWVILNTIDPELLKFPQFPTEAEVVGETPEGKLEEPKGVILRGNYFRRDPHDQSIIGLDPFELEVPSSIRDTRRVSRPDKPPVNLSGLGLDSEGDLTEIEFINPVDPQKGEPLHYYGAACFERPNYQGAVRIYLSHPRRSRGPLELAIPRPGANLPCQSLLIFRQPALSRHSVGDSIIFYELPYPMREEKESRCLKLDLTGDPEGCELLAGIPGVLDLISFPQLISPGDPPGIVPGRFSTTTDPAVWYPASMVVNSKPPGKYLIFLFQGDPGRRLRPHWDMGNAYYFQTDVEDFSDKTDPRLYWLHEPWQVIFPQSYIILQVEAVL
jgi:hypothetical protein